MKCKCEAVNIIQDMLFRTCEHMPFLELRVAVTPYIWNT